MGTTSLVLESERFSALLQQATVWADRFTLALVAPHSDHGALPAWACLLDAHAKSERIFVSRAEETEGWLLHRLHETGALSLVESAAPSFSGNVLAFRRGTEVRCFLAPAPLARGTLEVDCGVVLAFEGSSESDFGADCNRLIESWQQHSRVPAGSEIDLLSAARGDFPRVNQQRPTRDARFSIVVERDELASTLRTFLATLHPASTEAVPKSPTVELAIVGSRAAYVLGASWTLGVTVLDDAFQLQLDHSPASSAPAPIVLTLGLGERHAGGNSLVARGADGEALLVWRGGLLGSSRRKNAVLWSHSRLASFELRDDAHGEQQVVGIAASLARPIGEQLIDFGREVRRLQELFPSEDAEKPKPKPLNFAELGFDEQAALLWDALIGLGSLPLDDAIATVAPSLRDQGFVEYQRLRRDGALYRLIADVLGRALRAGSHFDRPHPGQVRAIQAELDAYSREDWLECLVHAFPEGERIDRASAIRLVFDYAREHWGLSAQRLRTGGKVESAVKSALNSAIRRGLIRRVGAVFLEKLEPGAPLAAVEPVAREALAREPEPPVEMRHSPVPPASASELQLESESELGLGGEPGSGSELGLGGEGDGEGEPESESESESEPKPAGPSSVGIDPRLLAPLASLVLPIRTANWAERQHMHTLRDLVAWHPDVFAEQQSVGRLTVAHTRAVIEPVLGMEWEDAWAALDEPKMHPKEAPLPAAEHSRWNQRLAELTPEQRAVPLSRIALPARMLTHCEQHGLHTVGALLAVPRDELLSQPNLGRTTLLRTLELIEDGLREASTPAADVSFLAAWQRHLLRLAPLSRLVVSKRSGVHGARETLEAVGEMLGVTRERIRQIEVQSLDDIKRRSGFVEELQRRLERAFAGGICLPLALLLESDPWWRGVEKHLPLIEYVFERLLDSSMHCLELERVGQRELLFARFDHRALREVEGQLLDSAAQIETPAPLQHYTDLVDAAARRLDPALREYLLALLEEHFNVDEHEPERVLSFGNTKHDQVMALLESQREPLHVSAVYEAVGRCRLPDEVLYFRRGVVGLEKHFPDFHGWMERLVPACIECMQELPAGRQWLVPELHQALAEAGKLPEWLGHWHLASLLRRSERVQYLGRLRVALSVDGASAERIHHQDAALGVLEQAGAPLSFAAIAERIRRRTAVHDATLHILLLSSPFVKLGDDSYGLVARDVQGGPESIARAVEAVVQALASSERGLTGHQAWQLAVARVAQPWSAELVTSLLRSEPQLRLARSGNVGLSSWDDVRAPNRGEFIRQHVERAEGQTSVESLQEALRDAYGRPLERGELLTECHRNELRLEGALVLGRQAPSPENPSPSPEPADLDLTGRVGGIPAAARQHFEELLRRPVEASATLLERARAHLAALEQAGSRNEFVEVSLAKRLVELYERLLEHVASLSPTTQRIAQAAVRYFISTDDAEDDFELAGLDDDKAVLDAVLKHLELDWS